MKEYAHRQSRKSKQRKKGIKMIKHVYYVEQFCECVECKGGDDWLAVGAPGNIFDFQVCENCDCPIQGTAATHNDDDNDE